MTFQPSPKYLTKLRLSMVLAAAFIWIVTAAFAWGMSLLPDVDRRGAETLMIVMTGLDLLWLVPGLLVSGPYYRSLHYEIEDDEVIMRVGIVTNSVKHVPYRTVTNVTVKRDPLDRWLFGLGTLNIQTAGMSGTTGAEESLVGLDNVQGVYEKVAGELRRFRGAMSPTAADIDIAEVGADNGPLTAPTIQALLGEVRAIRLALETGKKD